MSGYTNKDLNYKIPMEEDYTEWLKLVEYENAVLYKHGSIRGSKNRIEAYGDIHKFFLEGKSPEEVAQILFEHLRLENEEKERRETEARERMNARHRKLMEELDARVEGRKDNKKRVKEEVSLEYQLGIYVGDYIVMQYLPTLSVDWCHTKETVEVSAEDATRHAELYNIYTTKSNANEECKEEWKNYRDFSHSLEEKYLPAVLECSIHKISSIKNMDQFISGIRASLWDCDICCYNIDNIKVDDEYSERFTRILIPLR